MQRQSANPALPLWLLILIVGTIVGVSMGRTQSMGLYLPPVTKALDIGREPFGLAMALAQLTLGLGAPFFGGLIDKFGAGRIVVICLLAAIAGLYLMYAATSANDLLISGVLLGIGVSGTGITALVGTIGRLAPPEKRLSAIASIGMAAGIGGFVALPVMHLLIELVGWKQSLVWLMAITALLIPLAWPIGGKPVRRDGPVRDQTLMEALREAFQHPSFWLLTAGFFETHRPYPHDRYQPADADTVVLPDYLPDTADIREDLADFYGSISVADAAVGQLLDTLAATGLDRTTWVVFVTDHGPALPRAKSTLYDAGTGIAMIVRPPRGADVAHQVYDELFSGVDLVPTLLELLGVGVPPDIEGLSHARQLLQNPRGEDPVRTAVFTMKTYHDSFDPIRAIRTKEYSYIENYAPRPLLDLPWDIADSAPGRTVEPLARAPRPERELYDLVDDPTESHNLLGPEATDKDEAIGIDLALQLDDWRQKTKDVIPSDFAGTRIADRYTQTYAHIKNFQIPSRAAKATDRGITEITAPGNSSAHRDRKP